MSKRINQIVSMFTTMLVITVIGTFFSCADTNTVKSGKYTYKTYKNDPLKSRIYKLDNGLTVYMTVYKDAPRIQTAIAVRAGSKNDPADATGLAHYLEHLLFKGTSKYGTLDYASEKAEIDKIFGLYEQRRAVDDSLDRVNLYHQIDSISYVASKYAIANEYDKMVGSLGAKGTNAYTWVEQTVYINDIPSNQFEKWVNLEAERFREPVLRLFHTELEVVYEEKNRCLDNDRMKAREMLYANLFKKHQYGTQTTIGKIEDLKNPSLMKVDEYRRTYYVPNNIAICISGDFDPDLAIKEIDESFKNMPYSEVPKYVPPVEEPITAPIEKEVFGPDAENVTLAFRFGGAGSKDADLLEMTDMILMNGTAGLIDLNLNQSQAVISAYTSPSIYKDYSIHTFGARPREGQSLEEVKELLLSQIELLKKGEFPDWLPEAVVTNFKMHELQRFESNYGRASTFVNAFIHDLNWKDVIEKNDRLAKITKQNIIDFANKNYINNYVVVYKRTGVDENVKKVVKPEITPVELNNQDQSEFAKNLMETKAEDIEPVFLDYDKDILKAKLANGIPVLYNKNVENDIFKLYYILDMGTLNNREIGVALDYLEYLGTSEYTPAQIQEEFYKLGCSFLVHNSDDQVYVSLVGLKENFEKGIKLFESLLSDAQPNPGALENLKKDILKKRSDQKLSKRTILFSAMYNYGVYGSESPYTYILNKGELEALSPDEQTNIIKNLNGYEHRVLYYGPHELNELTGILDRLHKVPAEVKPVPPAKDFVQLETDRNKIYFIDYDMKQVELILLSKSEQFNSTNAPVRRMFNEYYGGSMSSVVFTTLRESKALAYSVYAAYRDPNKKEDAHYIFAYIGTQSDKLAEALYGMSDLLNEMPETEVLFESSKESILKQIQTERITKSSILFNYESAVRMGLDHDIRKDIYDGIQNMTLSDIKAFHNKYFKEKRYTYLVIGDKNKLDFKKLQKFGKLEKLSLADVFGY